MSLKSYNKGCKDNICDLTFLFYPRIHFFRFFQSCDRYTKLRRKLTVLQLEKFLYNLRKGQVQLSSLIEYEAWVSCNLTITWRFNFLSYDISKSLWWIHKIRFRRKAAEVIHFYFFYLIWKHAIKLSYSRKIVPIVFTWNKINWYSSSHIHSNYR